MTRCLLPQEILKSLVQEDYYEIGFFSFEIKLEVKNQNLSIEKQMLTKFKTIQKICVERFDIFDKSSRIFPQKKI